MPNGSLGEELERTRVRLQRALLALRVYLRELIRLVQFVTRLIATCTAFDGDQLSLFYIKALRVVDGPFVMAVFA